MVKGSLRIKIVERRPRSS